jgi:hypothetical protein
MDCLNQQRDQGKKRIGGIDEGIGYANGSHRITNRAENTEGRAERGSSSPLFLLVTASSEDILFCEGNSIFKDLLSLFFQFEPYLA